MTFERSLDDLPLAAYGGGGMDLTAEDEAKLDPPMSDAGSGADANPPGPLAHAVAADADPVVPGPYAHAVAGGALPDDNYGAGPAASKLAMPPIAAKVMHTLRTSRAAQGAAFAGVVLVGLVVVVGGMKPGAAGAEASPSAAPVAAATREPGNATLVLTGDVEQSVAFLGSAGSGSPNAALSMTWTDLGPNTLGLTGPVDRGTRSTAKTLVLQWTILVDDAPVTFTSTDGECTLGMAVNPTNVSGTFACKKLESDDGEYVVGATGTYRT
jgi:hypothetical protein